MNQASTRREKLSDKVCVVTEVSGDEHNVISVVSAQKFVKKRRLFDAFFVEVRFEAVV